MTLRIIHSKDGMYDIYDKESGKWLFSRMCSDNVFEKLAKYDTVKVEFVDEVFDE